MEISGNFHKKILGHIQYRGRKKGMREKVPAARRDPQGTYSGGYKSNLVDKP